MKASAKRINMPSARSSKKVKSSALQKPKTKRIKSRWTPEEVRILRRYYRTHSNAATAKILGREVASIVFKGFRLGLSKGIRRMREMGRENISRRWHPKKPAAKRIKERA